jgi:hypothetical protein
LARTARLRAMTAAGPAGADKGNHQRSRMTSKL